MSTDRELLELAAKAAGVDVWFPRMSDGNGGAIEPCHTMRNGHTMEWKPLTDDGDALQLAVKLRMEVYHADDGGWSAYASHPTARGIAYAIEPHRNNPCAATRRAIVRAAAEIGRKK